MLSVEDEPVECFGVTCVFIYCCTELPYCSRHFIHNGGCQNDSINHTRSDSLFSLEVMVPLSKIRVLPSEALRLDEENSHSVGEK